MNNTPNIPTDDELFAVAKKVLVDALGVDDDEVVPHATINGDLGAESIDWLDISFRLEQELNIRYRLDRIFAGGHYLTASVPTELTDEGVEFFQKAVPDYPAEVLAEDRTQDSIERAFSVEHLVSSLRKACQDAIDSNSR